MNVTIRNATEGDCSQIAGLSGELGYPAVEIQIRERVRAIAQSVDDAVFVAEIDPGEIAGWAQVQVSCVLESGYRAEIVGLVVSGKVKRQGVGRKLVEAAERWACGRGAHVIVVRSNVKRVESHAFYAALGYGETKMQRVYRKRVD